jgi:hypothetical protein
VKDERQKGRTMTPQDALDEIDSPHLPEEGVIMAQQSPTIAFEDVPLDEARRMGCGPRMEPMLYDTLRQKIQSLSSEAVRIHLGPEIRPDRMKNYLIDVPLHAAWARFSTFQRI